MRVYFIRHAQAKERTPLLPDEHRSLTCRGRKRFRQVAACLKKMDISPDLILTSPKVRAVQTAEILCETIRFNGEVVISPELSAGPDLDILGKLLQTRPETGELVIVGHEPSLGELIGNLLRLSAPCHVGKGCVVSMKISVRASGFAAALTGLITGGGKAIRSADAALERLQTRKQIGAEEGTP